jgi:hypothetical protein
MPTRRQTLITLAAGPFASAAGKRDYMRILPESNRFTVRAEDGWYMHSAGVAALGDELVCTYRRSDEHVASEVEVWCCRSKDGGRSWTDHRLITRLGWEPDKAAWVAPQLGKTRDGRLLLLIDRGEKLSKFDWPMLSQWQMKDRGMSNHLFVSNDRGRTWQGPRKVDDVGGEPSYIVELSNGTLMYTRTDSRPTNAKKYPAMPWGPNYYRSTAVFSHDNGRTWSRTVPLTDDPLVGDCEVGVAEYASGRLVAITRIGDAGSRHAQPSRWVFSDDFGKTWSKPVLGPIYAHRAYIRTLRDGRLMASFRNASGGTTGTAVFAWKPGESLPYAPQGFQWEPSTCSLWDNVLEMRTRSGVEGAAEFMLYPMEDDESELELEFDLLVKEAQPNACNVCAGGWVRFTPGRVEIAHRPEQGFTIAADRWHTYRLVNKGLKLAVFADGEKKLEVPTDGIFTRDVTFGNRPGLRSNTVPAAQGTRDTRRPLRGLRFEDNAGLSHWTWTGADGYPDQFARDRLVLLERNASFAAGDSGYSSWDQLPDGTAVVVDYTSGSPARSHPLLRAYRLDPRQIP